MPTERILVGLSGGVDSSVAAAILRDEGHDVIGAFLQLSPENADDSENACCSIASLERARRVATMLGIPFYVLNARERFHTDVYEPWRAASIAAETPNPCLTCNRALKIGHLLTRARELDCAAVATGHYARIDTRDGFARLVRGVDKKKDQSYVLARLSEEQLAALRLPVGRLTKPEVRARAAELQLPTRTTADSMDLCFAPRGIADVLSRDASSALVPGNVRDVDGRTYPAHHEGLALYTIGQRRGLPISGTESPRYVVDRDPTTNTLIVGGEEHLQGRTCRVRDLILRGIGDGAHVLLVQVRAHTAPARASVTILGDGATITFDEPQRAITPGQAAALYDGDVCIGAGVLTRA